MNIKTFALLGIVLGASLSLVCCEDKPLSEVNDSGNIDGDGQFIYVLDSAFSYTDGKLMVANYHQYDSKGRRTYQLNRRYGLDGNLITNEERTFHYSGEDSKNYSVYLNANGLGVDQKTDNTYIGSDDNYINTNKTYILQNGVWSLVLDYYQQRDITTDIINNVRYAFYNGEKIVISRGESRTTYDPLTGLAVDGVSVNYFITAYSGNDRFNLTSLGQRRWGISKVKYDTKGRELEYISWDSNDSVSWNETQRQEHRYDSRDNLIEQINNNQKIVYIYENNRPLKDEYYEKSETGSDFELFRTVDYSFSTAGMLTGIEINSTSNDISIPVNVEAAPSDLDQITIAGRIINVSLMTSAFNDNRGSRCVIECDTNGNPVNQTLYRYDSDGNMVNEPFQRCNREYDYNNNCTSSDVETLKDRGWEYTENTTATYDFKGNMLSYYSYSNIESVTSYWNALTNSLVSYKNTTETRQRTVNRYNPAGMLIYQYRSQNTHRVNSDESVNDTNSESIQENYYSTIKVK